MLKRYLLVELAYVSKRFNFFNIYIYSQMDILGTAGVTWDENVNLVLASMTALA